MHIRFLVQFLNKKLEGKNLKFCEQTKQIIKFCTVKVEMLTGFKIDKETVRIFFFLLNILKNDIFRSEKEGTSQKLVLIT